MNNPNPDNHSSSTPTGNGQEHAAKILQNRVHQTYQKTEQQVENPYDRTHQQDFDWRKYHTAWQEYYQKYYHAYYSQQMAQQHQQLAAATKTADQPRTNKTRIERLRNEIRRTVSANASKFRRSKHFAPVMIALAIGFTYLFLQFNTVLFAQVKSYISPGNISSSVLSIDPLTPINVGADPKLIIPKINVEVPVDYSTKTLDENKIQLSLRDGATYFPIPGASALPGEKGNTVILGHSSNDIFNQGKYKFVFVLLDHLEVGDIYYLHYNGTRYIYKVTEKRVIDPRDIAALQRGTDKALSTLITCTPPGTDLQRLLIYGEQISPDPSGAKPAAATASNSKTIPGNEPSWLDNIWRSLFGG